MIITTKQISILQTLLKNKSFKDAEYQMDIDELIQGVDYEVSKQALQFSLRSLISKGIIGKCAKEDRQKRRGRKRTTVWITEAGLKVIVARKDDGITAYLEENL